MHENNLENPVFTSKRMEQQHTRMQGVKMVNSGHPVAHVANFFNVSARAVYKGRSEIIAFAAIVTT